MPLAGDYQTVKSMASLTQVLRTPETGEAVTRFDASCQRLTYHHILTQHKKVAFQASQFKTIAKCQKCAGGGRERERESVSLIRHCLVPCQQAGTAIKKVL